MTHKLIALRIMASKLMVLTIPFRNISSIYKWNILEFSDMQVHYESFTLCKADIFLSYYIFSLIIACVIYFLNTRVCIYILTYKTHFYSFCVCVTHTHTHKQSVFLKTLIHLPLTIVKIQEVMAFSMHSSFRLLTSRSLHGDYLTVIWNDSFTSSKQCLFKELHAFLINIASLSNCTAFCSCGGPPAITQIQM